MAATIIIDQDDSRIKAKDGKVYRLTGKQLGFANDYVNNGRNATAAYRNNYNVKNMKDKNIWEESCKLLSNIKVAQRIEQLEAENAKASTLEREDLVRILCGFIEDPELKVTDRIKAMERLAKFTGMDEPAKSEVEYSERLGLDVPDFLKDIDKYRIEAKKVKAE